MISNTIKNIYYCVLVENSKIRLNKNIIYTGNKNNIVKRLLYPVCEKVGKIEPNEFRRDMEMIFYKRYNEIPKCKMAFCGENVELGYRYCEYHQQICNKCKIREADFYDGRGKYCYKCCAENKL